MGDQPHQQWTQLIADVLDQHAVVGIQALLRCHLGRAPTRSERQAAHRAARTMAGDGRITLRQIRARPNPDARLCPYVLVGRVHLGLLEWPTPTVLQAVALNYPPPALRPQEPFEKMLETLYETVRRLDMRTLTRLGADASRAVADAIDPPLAELARVQRQLRRRTHS